MSADAFVRHAKIFPNGRITLPKDVRDALGISYGDNITFLVEGSMVHMVNSAVYAMQMLQAQMQKEAERAGFTANMDESAIKLVAELRKE